MENLARYIIRVSFSQKRTTYHPEKSRIIYRSKDNLQEKAFDALDWLADVTFYIPNLGEQWFPIMATLVTSPGDFVKKKIKIPSFPNIYGNTLRVVSSSDGANCRANG